MSKEANQLLDSLAEWHWWRLKQDDANAGHWADICRWHAAQLIGRGV